LWQPQSTNRAFQVTADVPEIYMQEFWATAMLHHNSIRFKMDTKKSILDLEAFREMLHISPRIPSQSFVELPFEEEILDSLKFLGHSHEIRHLTDVNVNKLYQPWRSFSSVINKCLTGKSSGIDKAEQLKIVLKKSRQETHISQQRDSGINEGTGSRPGVPNVPSDDSEEELSWNSFDDEEGDEQTKGREESEGDKTDESDDGSDDGNDDDDETVKAGSESDKDDDDNDDEEEPTKNDDEDTESGKGGDEVSESEGESDEEETRQEEEESFDPIPRTPEGSEDESNDEEDQELRLSEEARIQEEKEADEIYLYPDGPQESSSVSSFMTSMLNPISDAGVESIFTTASSSIVSLQTPTPIMTPSTISTITTSADAPIPPTTIPSIILENLPTFNSAFRFDERLRSLETTFFEYRQTNSFVDAVSMIPDIVHQYMTQQMTEAV
nr:hypothetical protein [Tanacetum cinerariifolium]